MRRCNCKCNSCSMNCNTQNNYRNNCNCRNHNYNMYHQNNVSQNNNVFPENYLYGYAYTPIQYMNRTLTPEAGLENGSLFPELVSPYTPGQSIDFIEYLRNGGM